jgi:hypothetical protein
VRECAPLSANEARRSTRAKDFCSVVWKVRDAGGMGSMSPLAARDTVGPPLNGIRGRQSRRTDG